jgi:hypothetical protein
MGKHGKLIAGILILAALIVALSLLGREGNKIIPSEEGIQAGEEKELSSRQTSAGDIASHTEGRDIPGKISTATPPSDVEADTEKGGDLSSPSADEPDFGSGSLSEAPMSSADFKALVEERKEASAREQGPEALEDYRMRTEAREEERIAREELRQKLGEFNDERREWKRLMDEARDRARQTGDFTEVDRLREMRPKPPRKEPSPPDVGENN